MKTIIPYTIIGILLGLIVCLFLKPKPVCKPITIVKTEYRDSPKIDSLQSVIDTIQSKVVIKKLVFYKYVETIKDSIHTVHDTIILLADDIIHYQDSLITKKDSIIGYLTNELRLAKDTAYYFQTLYIDQKNKTKRWRRISFGSMLLNGVLILKN